MPRVLRANPHPRKGRMRPEEKPGSSSQKPAQTVPRLEHTGGSAIRLFWSLLGHVFWPINKFNYRTRAAPGWGSLDVSNRAVVLHEEGLAKDRTKKTFSRAAGANGGLGPGRASAAEPGAACSDPRSASLHTNNFRPFRLLRGERGRARSAETALAPGYKSNFCRVWSFLKVENI